MHVDTIEEDLQTEPETTGRFIEFMDIDGFGYGLYGDNDVYYH